LAVGEKATVAWLRPDRLPWSNGGEASYKNFRLYYQIVLGCLPLEDIYRQLVETYQDKRIDLPVAKGNAALATIMVDQRGKPVEGSPVALSSFAWGVPLALAGKLDLLATWPVAEKKIVRDIENNLNKNTPEDNNGMLTWAAIEACHRELVTCLNLPPSKVEPPKFAIRSYQHFKTPEPPEPLLLNSFFLGDLAKARDLFEKKRATTNLRRYLGVDQPAQRQNLLADTTALEAAVAPQATPPGRWPGKGRHSLVLLQQAAVNLATQTLKERGLLSVNGPPGTGKTTLLRDLVAALVTSRAEVLATFDDPETAFSHSGEKIGAGSAWLHLYRLDPRLKGFEILVASSNNKAVENISAELPGLDAIADDAKLRYFKTTADILNPRKDSWGLVAGILGNSKNRHAFRQTFWWDDEVGLSTYLAHIAGSPRFIEKTDPQTGETYQRRPRIVLEDSPPDTHEEALARWRSARTAFRNALSRSRRQLAALETARQNVHGLAETKQRIKAMTSTLNTTRTEAKAAEAARDRASGKAKATATALAAVRQELLAHDRAKPELAARLLRLASARTWQKTRDALVARETAAATADDAAKQALAAEEQALHQRLGLLLQAEQALATATADHAACQQACDEARDRLGAVLTDPAFFARPHEERHKATPWLGPETQRIRDEVFIAAIELHRAFVDAAAKPLRHNLGALMTCFSGKALPTPAKAALVPDLWSSLFLVVPVISTTFASVERMLGPLPPESLGWLLIDEAGQAVPQAAVGALMRTCRAVVVGDPLQIEPVVTLPRSLTEAIFHQFGADSDRFNAPEASVQTLSDQATPFTATFPAQDGERTVGVPLLVHRRCREPMFGISNRIAYGGLMVQAKTTSKSIIREVLGPSAWLDIRGSASDKWSEEEGWTALSLLRRLIDAGVGLNDNSGPDLYLITPFRVVQREMREMIRRERIAETWGGNSESWGKERVGTVHTVQGREAEAVILILGAPASDQTGARTWAGSHPNLLNVAVTRAKEALYVIGNREVWHRAGVFQTLDGCLPRSSQQDDRLARYR